MPELSLIHIFYRKKDVRPEINNKVVENRANEIVSFKVGYLMGEPVQYVSRKDDKGIAEAVTRLNDYTLSEDKPSEDAELAEWWHICGTSYRMVLPDGEADLEEDEMCIRDRVYISRLKMKRALEKSLQPLRGVPLLIWFFMCLKVIPVFLNIRRCKCVYSFADLAFTGSNNS